MDIEFVVSADSVEKLEIISRLLEKIGCQRIGERTIGDGFVLCRSFIVCDIIDDSQVPKLPFIELASTAPEVQQIIDELANKLGYPQRKPNAIASEFERAQPHEDHDLPDATGKPKQLAILRNLSLPSEDRRPPNGLDAGKRVG